MPKSRYTYRLIIENNNDKVLCWINETRNILKNNKNKSLTPVEIVDILLENFKLLNINRSVALMRVGTSLRQLVNKNQVRRQKIK